MFQQTCFLVVDVRVKRGAELSTDHYLVCILRGLNYPKTRKRLKTRRTYRIKWKLLADKKIGHTFPSKVTSLFREFPNHTEDVETEWDFFKSIVIIFAAASCGCKRVMRKELLGGIKKQRKLYVQRKLRLELG